MILRMSCRVQMYRATTEFYKGLEINHSIAYWTLSPMYEPYKSVLMLSPLFVP